MASSLTLTLGLLFMCTLASVHCDTVKVWGLRASGLDGDVWPNPPDAYVMVWCGNVFGGQTNIVDNNYNPSWGVEFSFSNVKLGSTLKLEVWDKDVSNNDLLGTCATTVKQGSYDVTCSLKKGTLYYHYRWSLSQPETCISNPQSYS